MKILLCGGGTGGHITPILAIARELKLKAPSCEIIYVGDHGGKFADLTKGSSTIDRSVSIYAGKFRRYHNQSWLVRLTDVKTLFFNIRDFFYFVIGIIQSTILLKRLHPDVVFLKGGYVGLPVGLAARLWRIPFVTHDSDAIPGLTNKVVGKWAAFNATGVQTGVYPYAKDKIRFVGVPLAPEYEYVTDELRNSYRKQIGAPIDSKVLFITGGSLGAVRINRSIAEVSEQLLDKFSDLYVYHQVGGGKLDVYDDLPDNERLKKYEFLTDIYKYTGAADVVITRSGATQTAELAAQAKPCILIPNPFLTGGHQSDNADILSKSDSAEVVDEEDLIKHEDHLFNAIVELLSSTELRKQLSQNIHKLATPNAANDIATLLLSVVKET